MRQFTNNIFLDFELKIIKVYVDELSDKRDDRVSVS